MDLQERIARLSPTKLALLQQKLEKNKPVGRPQAEAQVEQRQAYTPLSFSQERLWFLEQMEPDSCLYNLPAILPLRGPVDPSLVEDSVRRLVARHSALRTRFVVKDDSPYQVIDDDDGRAVDFSTIDLRVDNRQSGSRNLSQLLNDEIWVPFDLAMGPLLRVRLILQRNQENVLLVVMHHIVSDGWSIDIFTNEFRALYEAAHSGRDPSLPPLPRQYVDYSISQRESLQGDRLESLLAYWRTQLDGAPSVLGLPLDHPRPARQSFEGTLYPFVVPPSSLREMRSLCRDCGVVPFMVLLSTFEVLLFRYTHQPKIVVGTPIANRNHSELEAVIGFFTNTLVLCNSITPDMTFRDLLAQVRETTLGAYEHQDLPFEKLVSELQPERSLSHNPLFQVMFTFQNLPTRKPDEAGAAQAVDPVADGPSLDVELSKFDLTLAMTETGAGLSAVFEYATDLFEADTIERMATHFVNIVEYVLQNPDERITDFSFLSTDERNQIVEQWNDTSRSWDEILPLHRRFERWARKAPDSTAVMFREMTLTYEQLDKRANRIARLLRSQGVEQGAIVGICLRRSLEMVMGLFGILKAGAAYMPIEPDTPDERVAYMLEDAQVTHVLTTSDCSYVLAPHLVHPVALDEFDFERSGFDDTAPDIALGRTDLAYVLFTSGSTGQPKGVMVSHGAIDNRLQWMQERYELTINDRVMQKTPFTFDVSVWEFFWPLSEGACLVVAEPDRHKESVYLVDLIEEKQVTCMHFVPSMLQLFLHEDVSGCESLKRIICSGEALTVEQCRWLQALPKVSGHNLYGPTEAAIDVTHWDCANWSDQYLSVPIGRPITNTQIYILDEALRPSPIGVSGELYIGGHNLAEGYLNKPEMTAERFIATPFVDDPDARLYRTGDLARFRSDGNIEYIGRVDSQVKLRGLRIELGEIEVHLREYPGIAEAVVTVNRFGDYDERLVAYVVLDGPATTIDASEVSVFLGKKLPNYMVPSLLMAIPELPLTPNGKLDRKRLPEPTAATVSERSSEPAEPTDDIERELLGIWRKFLKIDTLGINDDFFDLGGHSILATRVVNSINGHYHLNLPVRLLFEYPTVKTLARALSEFEDEAWLDESRSASSMLTRSDLHLLQTLDEASEEQINDYLRHHLDDPAVAGFDDMESLLEWARSYLKSEEGTRNTATRVNQSPAKNGIDSLSLAYLRHYSELAQIKAGIKGIHADPDNAISRSLSPDATRQFAARLQARGSEVFDSYVRVVKQQVVDGNGTKTPEQLRYFCGQLISMAHLASLGPFGTNDYESLDKRQDDVSSN